MDAVVAELAGSVAVVERTVAEDTLAVEHTAADEKDTVVLVVESCDVVL